MASGEIQTPRSYKGRSLHSRFLGQETLLYLIMIGSQPARARSHTPLQGGIASCWNSTVQIGAYMEQRKNRRTSLQLVSTSGRKGSMARMAFSCVLWCSRLGIRVILYGMRWHIGISMASHCAPDTRRKHQKHTNTNVSRRHTNPPIVFMKSLCR